MAVKYLAGDRLQGTAAERAALTTGATSTCQGEAYSGDYIGLGHTGAGGDKTHVGMSPITSNTLIGTVASGIKFKMRTSGSPTDPVVKAQIYNASNVLQQTSTNTIADLDGTFTLREFNFATSFTVTVGFKYVVTLESGTVSDSNRVDLNQSGSTADNNNSPYQTSSGWYNMTLPCTICFTAPAVYPNLPNGAIFEESDGTGKHYMWDGTNTWNEMIA
jgi:hypothetical protein